MGSGHRSVMAQFCHYSTRERNCSKNTLRQDEDGNSREHKEPKWRKNEILCSTVKMRSGRFVAESEHEKERLVTEPEAVLHSYGIAFAETTESEQAGGGLVVEAAAAAAAPHSIGNAFAESTEFKHADGRTVLGAAVALDLDDDASTTAEETSCALSEETNTAAKSQENKNEKTSESDEEIIRLVEERRNTTKDENTN